MTGKSVSNGANPKICLYCANRTGEVCAKCKECGDYRYLSPERLPHWEAPPRLPPMRELVKWPAAERLAIIYLVAWYAREDLKEVT